VETQLVSLALAIILLPLAGALTAGLFGKLVGRTLTGWLATGLVGVAFLLACFLLKAVVLDGHPAQDALIYTWVHSGSFDFNVALLLDRLSVVMVFIVTFVSFMVHIYTIGYMADDPGYQRFFSYVSLFTFAMLVLVLADNFLLMFFGWEGVGLVSYLLIGFWFKREAAVFGGLKAFLVNRIGDLGFILAMAAILLYCNNLNYHTVFAQASTLVTSQIHVFPHVETSAISVICILLFIGAMGKSAQVPFHVWLPESMEGPTPISALIHAATMVTAGIYMVARCSPLFELSPAALTFVIVTGATTALFMGILAVINFDIKRVIAYSTLSQLGYMTVALGASAYNAAIFHLVTHAFFKALLFLSAGSVIIAMHHEQDMRKMGGLASYMPITYLTFAFGALALSAIPPFSGFFSKDAIIDAVHLSTIPGAHYAYWCVLAGAFITPLYIFRALFLTFHGPARMDAETRKNIHESPWIILLPLIALAIPSLCIGGILIGPMLFAQPALLGDSIFVLPAHNVLLKLAAEFHGARMMAIDAPNTLCFWLALAGIVTAWIFNLRYTHVTEKLKHRFHGIYSLLVDKYGFDDFNQLVLVRGTRKLGNFFYEFSDLIIIDGIFVNGSGKAIRWLSRVARQIQSGYIYQYSLIMLTGLLFFLAWLLMF
jgi:NADH-quinone oxidoreductase subunit L